MKTYYNHKPLSLAYSYKYPRCVDYLIVDRTPFGSSESCGNDTDANSEQLDQGMIVKIKFCDDSIRKKNDAIYAGTFTAQFRTSPSVRRSGFRATVICFRQEDPPEG